MLRQAQLALRERKVHRALPDHKGPQGLRAILALRVPLERKGLKGQQAPKVQRELRERLAHREQ